MYVNQFSNFVLIAILPTRYLLLHFQPILICFYMVGRSMSEHLPYLLVVYYYYLLEGSIIPPNGCLLVDNNEIRIDVSTLYSPPSHNTVGHIDAGKDFLYMYQMLSSGLQKK